MPAARTVRGRTRRALFLGYTYRWIRDSDGYPRSAAWFRALSPVQRQLLGAAATRRRPLAPHRRRRAAAGVDEGTRVPGRIATLTGDVEGSSAVGARAGADGGALPGGGRARRAQARPGQAASPRPRSRTTARRRWPRSTPGPAPTSTGAVSCAATTRSTSRCTSAPARPSTRRSGACTRRRVRLVWASPGPGGGDRGAAPPSWRGAPDRRGRDRDLGVQRRSSLGLTDAVLVENGLDELLALAGEAAVPT